MRAVTLARTSADWMTLLWQAGRLTHPMRTVTVPYGRLRDQLLRHGKHGGTQRLATQCHMLQAGQLTGVLARVQNHLQDTSSVILAYNHTIA